MQLKSNIKENQDPLISSKKKESPVASKVVAGRLSQINAEDAYIDRVRIIKY
jgi:hypothetical protein